MEDEESRDEEDGSGTKCDRFRGCRCGRKSAVSEEGKKSGRGHGHTIYVNEALRVCEITC